MNALARTGMAVVHCSIYDETGRHEKTIMSDEYKLQRRLMGTLTSCPFTGHDEHGRGGVFFPFPDLSCRTPGRYRLRFALVVPDPVANRSSRPSCPFESIVFSDVFEVYTAKDFPGMRASSALTRSLRDQGCLISIKKGIHHSKFGGPPGGGSYNDLDSGAEEDEPDERRGHRGSKRSKWSV
jgi:hypothetical protein